MSVITQRCINWIQDAIKSYNRDHKLRNYPRVPDMSIEDASCMEYVYSRTRSDLTSAQSQLDEKMFDGFKGFVASENADEAMSNLQEGIDNYVKLAQSMHSPLLPDSSVSTDAQLCIQSLQARDRRRNERFLELMALPATEDERRENVMALFGYAHTGGT